VTLRHFIVVAGLLLSGAGCHMPVCDPAGFDDGERFRLTIGALTSVGTACDVAAINRGETLTVVAGGLTKMSDGCSVRSAAPEIPGFAKDLVSACEGEARQLGQRCHGGTTTTMYCVVETSIGPEIQRSDQSLDGTFVVNWSGTCAPHGGCTDAYDVHIERLPP
jgi:hypothetical protein